MVAGDWRAAGGTGAVLSGCRKKAPTSTPTTKLSIATTFQNILQTIRARSPRRLQLRMFTAREPTMAMVVSDTSDWAPMTSLAVIVSGSVSVGLKAVELVSDR